MIFCQHIPAEPLARYVDRFWFFKDIMPVHQRERVLPDGTFELIINLDDEPRRLFDRTDAARDKLFRRAWLSGTHSRFITIDARPHASMIGVHFKPGGASAVLGMPADELRDEVVELDAVWGERTTDLRDQLLAGRAPAEKFRVLERFLLRRVRATTTESLQTRRVLWARDRFMADAENANVGRVVDQLGMSHKHFIDQFRRHVGLTPKLFCRIQRFQQVLSELNARRTIEWADVAYSCGYFDQAHFVHDFQEFSGLNPTAYATARPEHPNFVPVDERR